ncbi:hypothetical protein ACFQQB_08390 [Nonomuraea rubra]|uniref:hypothetical protein n=1 Tax=Nonomuraea rubra TaxID=46180 RepID=UPI00360D77F7
MRDSRRARLILGVLLAAALVILTIDHRTGESSPLRPLRAAGSYLFGTAEQFGGGVMRPVSTFVHAILTAPAARERIEALKAENAKLRSGLLAGKLDADRSKELERLVGLAGAGGTRWSPATWSPGGGSPGSRTRCRSTSAPTTGCGRR